ncbi:MAG: hypothetical protein Q8R92_01285 [Deltaproteobacteria bacterium]|nr:hypothetical protein [Deltaproteobacteria bacterium]
MERLLGRWSEIRRAVITFTDSNGFLAVLVAIILAALFGLVLLRLLRKLVRRLEWRVASWRITRFGPHGWFSTASMKGR